MKKIINFFIAMAVPHCEKCGREKEYFMGQGYLCGVCDDWHKS